jgi:hypothetical protein
MDTKYDFGHVEAEGETEARIVYVRPVAVNTLPEEVRAQVGSIGTLYAVHDASGERLALVNNRKLAFALAREHDFSPVSAH